MTESKKVLVIDPSGSPRAELLVENEEEGWFTGTVVSQDFSREVRAALAWYDEVIRDQMLSYLDDATAGVESFKLRAKFPDGSTHRIYSLHVGSSNEVSFRISPVLPPSHLSQSTVP
jgi:hypothetical protein